MSYWRISTSIKYFLFSGDRNIGVITEISVWTQLHTLELTSTNPKSITLTQFSFRICLLVQPINSISGVGDDYLILNTHFNWTLVIDSELSIKKYWELSWKSAYGLFDSVGLLYFSLVQLVCKNQLLGFIIWNLRINSG